MFKRAKVVMLPTNEKAQLVLGQQLANVGETNIDNDEEITKQHLYITSDDEIKEGDWFIANQGVHLCIKIDKNNTQYPYNTKNNEGIIINHSKHWNTKIIATTDNSLKLGTCDNCNTDKDYRHNFSVCECKLPRPSQSFIQKYVEEYNKNNIITDVLIEYSLDKNESYSEFGMFYKYILKISKDNTITIKKVKESWNRNEVIKLLLSLNNDKAGNFDCSKWIEENL